MSTGSEYREPVEPLDQTGSYLISRDLTNEWPTDRFEQYIYFEELDTSRFCYYLNITLDNFRGIPKDCDFGSLISEKSVRKSKHVEYEFKLNIAGTPNTGANCWKIWKRYKDFDKLLNSMKENFRNRDFPALPSKLIAADPSKRGTALEDWLRLVVNQKMLCNDLLLEFVLMGRKDIDNFQLRQNDSLFSHFSWKVNVTNFEKVSADGQNEPFIRYTVDINIWDKKMNSRFFGNMSHQVGRRDSDFYNLWKLLKVRFKDSGNVKVPSFPRHRFYTSKLMDRVQELDQWIGDVCQSERLFDCISFLKFLEINPVELHDKLFNQSFSRN
jgi:hypothetical protein